MKTFLAASLVASAAAFTTSHQSSKSSGALQAKAISYEDDFGAMLPLGFWDPLGLVKDADQETFDRLRLTEIKHGRIAMLAVVGFLFQESGARLPGAIDLSGTQFADIPNGYAALEAIPYAGKLQIFAFIGALEVFVMRDFTGGDFPGMCPSCGCRTNLLYYVVSLSQPAVLIVLAHALTNNNNTCTQATFAMA